MHFITMSSELEGILTSAFIAVFVCVVSGVLFFMFKHASFVPSVVIRTPRTVIVPKKKRKKTDSRKMKILKPIESTGNVNVTPDPDLDKSQTSDETTDESPSTPVTDRTDVLKNCQLLQQSRTHSGEKFEECGGDSQHTVNDSSVRLIHGLPLDEQVGHPITSHVQFNATQCQNASCHVKDNSDTNIASDFLTTSDPVPMPVDNVPHTNAKSKRSRRRATKKWMTTFNAPTDSSSVPLNMPTVEHMVHPVEELTKSTITMSAKLISDPSMINSTISETQEELAKITDQLHATELKLQEISTKAAQVSKENDRLHQKEEENTLGLRVLQQQYTELLRANKTIDHDKQSANAENKNLLIRLDQLASESTRRKIETEAEVRQLQEQLMEAQSKIASLTSPAKPHCPSPQSLLSNENLFLKSSLNQLESELKQLRQASLVQQQELQMCIVENRKLRDGQETVLEKLRTKHEVEKAEATSRMATFEVQLQRQCRELENEKQELIKKVSEVRMELSLRVDREKRLSEMISNLECQFADLRAEKQCLLEMVESSKAINEVSTNELLVQVANLTNELTRTATALQENQLRANTLDSELETFKATMTCIDKKDAAVLTERSVFDGDAESKQSTDSLRSQLLAVKRELKSSLSQTIEAQQMEEQAKSELIHYKSTLVQTEKLLAKLQDFVEDAERKWRQTLSDSQLQCSQFEKQLSSALTDNAKLTDQLYHKEQELVKMKSEISRNELQKPSFARASHKKLSHSKHQEDSYTVDQLHPPVIECSSAPEKVEQINASHVTSPTYVDDPAGSIDSSHVKPAGEHVATGLQESTEGLVRVDQKQSSHEPARDSLQPDSGDVENLTISEDLANEYSEN